MADIISLDSRRLASDQQAEEEQRQRKRQAVRQFFQCAGCLFKCERCGAPIPKESDGCACSGRPPAGTRRLCDDCREEYQDYLFQIEGNRHPRHYWHNAAWLKVWQSWLIYQEAIDRYLKSSEFQKLIREVRQLGLDQ